MLVLMQHTNIAIIGSGPAALLLALQLAATEIPVLLLADSASLMAVDQRILALSYASCAYLRDLAAWDVQLATAIKEVQLSHTGQSRLCLKAAAMNLDVLGYTINYNDLCSVLWARVKAAPLITLWFTTVLAVTDAKYTAVVTYKDVHSKNHYLSANLAVVADGGNGVQLSKNISYSTTRYSHSAVLATLTVGDAAGGHNNVAYERLDQHGPLALLPYASQHYSLIWSLPIATAAAVAQDNTLLLRLLPSRLINRFYGVKLCSKAIVVPVSQKIARAHSLNRVVLIGNAAQRLHPVAAQGLNLALRDVKYLAQHILHLSSTLAHDCQLQHYRATRQADVDFVCRFTQLLLLSSNSRNFLMTKARGVGLFTLNSYTTLQNMLMRRLIWGM